jgi:hypothetical protein
MMEAKGMDTADTVLAKGLTTGLFIRRGCRSNGERVERDGKRKGVTVWRLPVS